VPRSRFDELVFIAEENDGLLTTKQAREAGIAGSVLARLAQRGRLERATRGVYRIPHFPINRFSQYREAVLWVRADSGPRNIALSHSTALAVYGISDASPASVQITVPRKTRLRRRHPKWVKVHRADLQPGDVTVHEGLPITTVDRTVSDILALTGQIELVRQAVSAARREGYINSNEARRLNRRVDRFIHELEENRQLQKRRKKARW
jgi:predicted transcriptional regulator of viral defense system